MQIAESKNGGITVLALIGKLDTTTAKSLDDRWNELIAAGERRFVLDATALDYVNSSGLRVLLLAAKQLKDLTGEIAVCGLNPRTQNIFEMTGFTTIFPVYGTLHEAVQSLEAQ